MKIFKSTNPQFFIISGFVIILGFLFLLTKNSTYYHTKTVVLEFGLFLVFKGIYDIKNQKNQLAISSKKILGLLLFF